MYLRVCCMFALCDFRIASDPAFRRKRPGEALQPVLELACRNGSPINWTQPAHGDSISEGRDATRTRCQFASAKATSHRNAAPPLPEKRRRVRPDRICVIPYLAPIGSSY